MHKCISARFSLLLLLLITFVVVGFHHFAMRKVIEANAPANWVASRRVPNIVVVVVIHRFNAFAFTKIYEKEYQNYCSALGELKCIPYSQSQPKMGVISIECVCGWVEKNGKEALFQHAGAYTLHIGFVKHDDDEWTFSSRSRKWGISMLVWGFLKYNLYDECWWFACCVLHHEKRFKCSVVLVTFRWEKRMGGKTISKDDSIRYLLGCLWSKSANRPRQLVRQKLLVSHSNNTR